MTKHENGNSAPSEKVVDFAEFKARRDSVADDNETLAAAHDADSTSVESPVPPQMDIISDLSDEEVEKYISQARSLIYDVGLKAGLSKGVRKVGTELLERDIDDYEQAVVGNTARRLSQIGLVVLGARGLSKEALDYSLVSASLNRVFLIYELARTAGLAMNDHHLKQATMVPSDRAEFSKQKHIRARTRELLGVTKVNHLDYDQKVRPMMVSTGFGTQVATAAMLQDEVLTKLFPAASRSGRQADTADQVGAYIRRVTNMDALIRRDNDPRYDAHRLLGTEFRYSLNQLRAFFAAETSIKPPR